MSDSVKRLLATIALCIFLSMLLIWSQDAESSEYFNAYETVSDAGVGTYADNGDYDHDLDYSEEDRYDRDNGTDYTYIDGKQCFRMRSSAGAILTCN